MAAITDKGQRFAVLLFAVLSALYLIPEIIFNAKLVSVVSRATTDEALETIEIFGRAVSGVGLSLMVASLFATRKGNTGLFKILMITGLSFAVCWPTMYYGQKALVDTVVENSSAEQRRDSYLSFGIKHALRNGTLEINNIPFGKDRGSHYDDTFLILVGAMIYANQDVIQFFGDRKEEILTAYINTDANEEFEAHYASYAKHRTQMRIKFEEYQKGSKRYEDELSTIPTYQHQYWEKFNNELYQKWLSYKKYRGAFDVRVQARATEVAPIVFQALKHKNRCWDIHGNSNQARICAGQEEATYQKKVKKYGFGNVKLNYWLNNKSFSNEVHTYTPKVRQLMLKDFTKETGYEYSVDSYNKFKAHNRTSEQARKTLQSQYGLKLSSSWKVTHAKTFKVAVSDLIKEKALARWNSEMKERGVNVPPALSWSKYQHHASIQMLVKAKVGPENYVSPMLFDWNDADFKKHVFASLMKRRVDEAIEKINASLPKFEKGGEYYLESKNSLKAILVPPVSMTISLFLIIFTMFGTVKKGLLILLGTKKLSKQSHAQTEIPDSAVSPELLEGVKDKDDRELIKETYVKEVNLEALTKQTHKVKPVKLSLRKRLLSPVLSIAFMIALVVVPLNFIESEFKGNKALTYMLDGVPTVMSIAVQWALIMQPIFQELGQSLSEEVKIYEIWEEMHVSGKSLERVLADRG